MSRFNEFLKAQEDARTSVPGTIIDGAFQCQVCYETCDEAEYFQMKRLLKWSCDHGHISYIEEFML